MRLSHFTRWRPSRTKLGFPGATRLRAFMAQDPGDKGTSVRSQGFIVLVGTLKEGLRKSRVYRTVMNKLKLKLGSVRDALNKVRGNFA